MVRGSLGVKEDENEVDEKGKGNLGQESVETALLSMPLQQQNSSVCALTSFLICRSTDEWLQLQASIPQGQEFHGDGVWHTGTEHPAKSSCHLCRGCHANLIFFPFLSFCCPPGAEQAVIDFWVLSAMGTLSQEAGGQTKLLFQAVPEQGPVALWPIKRCEWLQSVAMMNGQLCMVEQIDHCISRHNSLISAERAVHFCAHGRDTIIPTDNIPVLWPGLLITLRCCCLSGSGGEASFGV